MDQRNKRRDAYDSDKYLRHINDSYVFDIESGLYTPQAYASERERAEANPGSNPQSPLFIDSRTHWSHVWIPIVISLLTLVVVAIYTSVTQRILENTEVNTVTAIGAAWATRDAADAATRSRVRP